MMQKLQQQRRQNNKTVTDKMRIDQTMKEVEKQIDELGQRYKKFQNETTSSSERLAQLDELLEAEEKIKYHLSQETVRLNNVFYRSQQQLANLRSEEKILNVPMIYILSLIFLILELLMFRFKTVELRHPW